MWRRSLLVFLAIGAAVCAAMAAAKAPKKSDDAATGADRGRYLVEHVAMCVQCHTPRDAQGTLDERRLLQGATIPLQSPFAGAPWAPQSPTIAGLPGGWTEQDLVKFLRTGRSPGGELARAPMPPFRMSNDDATAIAAYLKTLPAR